MTIKLVLIAVLTFHFFMLIGIGFTLNEHEELNTSTKIKLFTIAFLLPILGPIYVNYVLRTKIFIDGSFFDMDDYSEHYQSGSAESVSSDSSTDGGGGSGD